MIWDYFFTCKAMLPFLWLIIIFELALFTWYGMTKKKRWYTKFVIEDKKWSIYYFLENIYAKEMVSLQRVLPKMVEEKSLFLTAYFKTKMMRNRNNFTLEVLHIYSTFFLSMSIFGTVSLHVRHYNSRHNVFS